MNYYNNKNRISGIYKITNIVNNKCYIGQSISIKNRWWDHENLLTRNKHHSFHLQRSWNKYGKENFKFEILEICPDEELNEKEIKFVNLYKVNDRKFGYNINEAGNAWSKERKEKMKLIFKNSKKRKLANKLSGLNKRGIGKVTLKYSLTGEFIEEYTCIKLAAESENLDKSAVAKCCKGKLNKTGNFIFKYKD